MPKQPPVIFKANGDRVRYSRKRLFTSLVRSGAPRDVANRVTDKVSATIIHGQTTTQEIYAQAYALLNTMDQRPIAARYSLKKAIMALGPTGYPFESFVARILNEHGYTTQVGVVMQGACVSHEVDVVGVKDTTHILVEAKFHNQPGVHTDVKVPLYIRSRFLDLETQLKRDGDRHPRHEPWIVTNTHFTSSAIAYGTCQGMTLIGWRYPETGGLESLVESTGLHPITCLSTLTPKDAALLLGLDILLCRDLLARPRVLESSGMSSQKARRVLLEAERICQSS